MNWANPKLPGSLLSKTFLERVDQQDVIWVQWGGGGAVRLHTSVFYVLKIAGNQQKSESQGGKK